MFWCTGRSCLHFRHSIYVNELNHWVTFDQVGHRTPADGFIGIKVERLQRQRARQRRQGGICYLPFQGQGSEFGQAV